MATTQHTHDYMARGLQNASPGVTNPVKDFVGRETTAADTDYLGRALIGAPGAIVGVVTDGEATVLTPVVGALVSADGHTDTTNAQGEYSISVPAGTYTVSVTAAGFVPATETDVTVASLQTVTVDFELIGD